MSKVVLITGCSTGIGRDLASRLTRFGHTGVATARKVDTLEGLDVALKLHLDVTRDDSISQAVEGTIQRFGRIDVLVNNAGYAVRGAIEELPVQQAQQMFNVNVFGVMRTIQVALPHMRKRRTGRIINISSISGKLVTPANGAYSATKFALEAISNAMRLELAPFGVQVVLIEPGSIKTQFHTTVEANAQAIFSNPTSPYRSLYEQNRKVTTDMRQQEPGPEAVSRVVQQAIEAARPKARYLVGFPFSGKLVLLLGDPVWDLVVRSMYQIRETQFSGKANQ